MKKSNLPFKIGDCISYNYLYSNEETKVGIVIKIKKDLNFQFMVTVLGSNSIKEIIPYSIMEFKII